MSYSILIADDEAEIRNLLRLYLENEHYNIIEAADGQQALDALQSHHIDLCILDIMMPKVDGFHVLQEMRQKSNIPVIILSAKDADSEKILGLYLGADDYLAKWRGLTQELMTIWQNRLIPWKRWRGSTPISAGSMRWAVSAIPRRN